MRVLRVRKKRLVCQIRKIIDGYKFGDTRAVDR